MRKSWAAAVLASMLVFGLAACGSKDEGKGGSKTTADIKTLIETKCSTCHFSSRIFEAPKSVREWKNIVQRMRARNPEMISLKEAKQITKYL